MFSPPVRQLPAACLATCLGLAAPAFAAHPLQTEDTGTQGKGGVELELGLLWSCTMGDKLFSYQPQLSFGITPAFDLILQPSWLSSQPAGQPTVRGWGDTNLDIKWRFSGEAPWSFAVRAGLQLPTSANGLGLAPGQLSSHALLVATYQAAPLTVHANLGLTQNPAGSGQRLRSALVSAAMMWSVNERLVLTADANLASNPDPARTDWAGALLVGAIYTVRPGLDVDLGYQTSWRGQQPSRQWLAGLTWRFAP